MKRAIDDDKHDQKMQRGERMQKGSFYTRSTNAAQLVKMALDEYASCNYGNAPGIIWEPSVGSGTLLLHVMGLTQGRGEYYGTDIDKAALVACKRRLDTLYPRSNVTLWKTDALHEDATATWRAGRRTKNGFDLIIGNPPWIGTKWDDVQNDSLHDRWRACFGRARPNLALLFLVNALDNLRDGGVLAFLIPTSLWSNTSLDAMRAKLLTTYTLARVCSFGRHTWWPEVTQEFCYTIFVNTPPSLHQTVAVCDGDALRSARVDQMQILKDPKLVLWGSSDLCSSLSGKTIKLSEWFTVIQIRSSVTSKDGCILIPNLRPQSTKSRITATVVSPGVPVDGVTHYGSWLLQPRVQTPDNDLFLRFVTICLQSKLMANYTYERCIATPTLVWSTSKSLDAIPMPNVEWDTIMSITNHMYSNPKRVTAVDRPLDNRVCELYGVSSRLCTYQYTDKNAIKDLYHADEIYIELEHDGDDE